MTSDSVEIGRPVPRVARAVGAPFVLPGHEARSPAWVQSQLRTLARARGPARRLLAALAARMVAIRGWERIGYARLGDYARERLGLAARSIHDLAHVHDALGTLPAAEAAMVEGRLTWTKVRLLARAASAGDEAVWVAFAERTTAAALAHEVRKADRACLERTGVAGAAGRGSRRVLALETDEDGSEVVASENVIVRCTRRVQAKWYHTRTLARRVAGAPIPAWQCLESVAAEVISGFPLDAEAAGALALVEPREPSLRIGGDGRAANGCEAASVEARRASEVSAREPANRCARTDLAEAAGGVPLDGGLRGIERDGGLTPADLPPELAGSAREIGLADAFDLDARLRAVVAFEQGLEMRMGPLLLCVLTEKLYRKSGAMSFEAWAREQLGLSPRRARSLVRIERAARDCPALATAYRNARLSWVQANALVPVVQRSPDETTATAWADFAQRVTTRRLLGAVDAALSLSGAAGPPPLESESAAAGARVDGWKENGSESPATRGATDRQTCAKSTHAAKRYSPHSAPTVLSLEEAINAPALWTDREDSRVMVGAPIDVARLFRATLASLRRRIERRTGRLPTQGEALEAMLDHVAAAWAPGRRHARELAVLGRDGWRCTVPGCSSLRNLHDHHIVYRSHSGSDALSNRTTLCAWHHLRAVHRGLVRCSGSAPGALRFELGLRTGRAPLAAYGSGDVRLGADARGRVTDLRAAAAARS